MTHIVFGTPQALGFVSALKILRRAHENNSSLNPQTRLSLR